MSIEQAAQQAYEAAREVALLSRERKDEVLLAASTALGDHSAEITRANAEDLEAARSSGLSEAKLQRLELTDAGIGQLCVGLREVAALADPVGAVVVERDMPSGLHVRRQRSPLGVVAMIYEARPGVTADAFALCFKAGNACILKGGREAFRTNRAIAKVIHGVLRTLQVPEGALTLAGRPEGGRLELKKLLGLDAYIDLVIPRGGRELIEFVHEHSRIPTVQHFRGVCHIYVDAAADPDMAEKICVTAKTSAPATCNAAECVLVHKEVAAEFVPRLVERYAAEDVVVHGGPVVQAIAPGVVPAEPEDWGREFLDRVIALRVVPDLEGALEHIGEYGSNHTEVIVTGDDAARDAFIAGVDASCVLVNASTRFNDGHQLGLGAEIGISTSKVHAYGPMGLEELTAIRYVVLGSGQVR